MRIILFIFALFILHPAHAQGTNAKGAPRLEIDPIENAVSVIIDGNTVAQFTSSGLMIHGNLEYAGTLRDTGHLKMKYEAEDDEESRNKSNAP